MTMNRGAFATAKVRIDKKLTTESLNPIYLGKWENKDIIIKKIIARPLEEHESYRKRCLKEIEITQQASGTYSVNIYGYVLDDMSIPAMYCLLLAYEKKGSLLDYCNTYPFIPLETSYRFFKEIVNGMSNLKKENIIHGDIKLSNVLIGADDQIKITDYGLSRFNRINDDAPNPNRRPAGTPIYMAPEVANKSRPISFKSDVFSLLCLLYFLMRGSEYNIPIYRDAENDDRKDVCKSMSIHYSKNLRYLIPTHWPTKISRLITWGWGTTPEDRITIEQLEDEVQSDIHTQSNNLQKKQLTLFGHHTSSTSLLDTAEQPREIRDEDLTEQKNIIPNDGTIEIRNAKLGEQQVSLKIYCRAAITQFRRECQIATLLQRSDAPCSDIIGYMANTTMSPPHYTIVSTFFSNITLDGYVRKKPSLTPDERFELARQAVKATAYVHSNGFIHCNIKPGKFLIDSDSEVVKVKITDFSRSQISPAKSASDGTYIYMAPEVINGVSPVSFAGDIFSLGRLLYFLMRGSELNDSDFGYHDSETPPPDTKRLVKRHYNKELRYKLDPAWPPKVARLITWGWATNPEDRITMDQFEKEMDLGPDNESAEMQKEKLTPYLYPNPNPSF